MFVNHVFPREPLIVSNWNEAIEKNYNWNDTFVNINGAGNDTIEIEEVTQKPVGAHAIHLLTRLNQIVMASHDDLNECRINVKCLNSSPENATRTFKCLSKASLAINQAVRRITIGYENAYLTKRSLLVRIRDAIYLLFGWQTERDKIHMLSVNIYKVLHKANNGLVPYSRKALIADRDYLAEQIEKLKPQGADKDFFEATRKGLEKQIERFPAKG